MEDHDFLSETDSAVLRTQAESILAALGIGSGSGTDWSQKNAAMEKLSSHREEQLERSGHGISEAQEPANKSNLKQLTEGISYCEDQLYSSTLFKNVENNIRCPTPEGYSECNQKEKDEGLHTIIPRLHSSQTPKKYDSTRNEKQKTESRRSQGRRSLVRNLSQAVIKKKQCCMKNCFSRTDHIFLQSEASRVLLWGRENRRKYLLSLLDPRSKSFLFSGMKVCYRFLESSFMFSRQLQSSVKKSAENGTNIFSTAVSKEPESPQRDAVVCFLDRFADSTADRIPDTNERHLPLFQKKAVYEMFCKQYYVLYGDRGKPSLPYFYSTWKKYCSDIKVRRIQRFTKCTECEYIRDSLEKMGTDLSRTFPLLERRRLHIEMVAKERREYQKKCEQAALYPSRFTSLIIDGADQSGYGLPHFSVTTKATVGHSLKVKLIGVLEHGTRKRLSLYTMTSEHETGANHIIEALHRTLATKAASSKLQGVLYLQVDNCTRENKNTFLFCYLECLVAWGVFQEIFVSFLPVGHTYADIDQAFSCTSRRLHSNDAATIEDLHKELRSSFTPEPFVVRMLHVVNFSALCKLENSIGRVKPFSKYRYFRFYRDEDAEEDSDFFQTACDVKIFCTDEWEALPTITPKLSGFTLRPPSLFSTPCNSVRSPPDRNKVLQRLRSEEPRINSQEKMRDLMEMVDQVYRDRDEPFHWNLRNTFELNGIYKKELCAAEFEDTDELHNQHEPPLSNLPYSRNRFVAVNGEGCTYGMPFWIGKILECIQNGNGVTEKLYIRWYEVYDEGNAWSGKYRPAVIGKGKSAKPWNGTISVDTVITEFPSLTNKKIRAGVEKEIRSGLSSLRKEWSGLH